MENKEMKLRKITEKPELLDVKGEGCWDDCYIGGYWTNKAAINTIGCNYTGPEYTAYNNIFS